MALHEIPLERRTLHGHFSRDLEPILTVDSGDSVTFACLNSGWRDAGASSSTSRATRGRARRRPCAVGPIEIRGARAGETLAVRIDDAADRARAA